MTQASMPKAKVFRLGVLKAIANLRSYVAASEDLAPEDTSPESLSKSLPAAKAWLASSQEKLQEAKAKVKTHQALL